MFTLLVVAGENPVEVVLQRVPVQDGTSALIVMTRAVLLV